MNSWDAEDFKMELTERWEAGKTIRKIKQTPPPSPPVYKNRKKTLTLLPPPPPPHPSPPKQKLLRWQSKVIHRLKICHLLSRKRFQTTKKAWRIEQAKKQSRQKACPSSECNILHFIQPANNTGNSNQVKEILSTDFYACIHKYKQVAPTPRSKNERQHCGEFPLLPVNTQVKVKQTWHK